MKSKRGGLILLAAIILIPCIAVAWFAWRYQSLNDDWESIVLTPDAADLTYCTMDGAPQKLDLYFPPGRGTGALPLLVYVHGGGWTGGDKRKGSEVVDIPAMTVRGYAVAAVNYRRAPEYKFPAPLNDVKCAIRFLRAHAAMYKLDPNRVGIWGGSAGGHLAAFVGLTDASAGFDVGEYNEQSSGVCAVGDLFGPTDLTVEMSLLQKLLLYRAFETIDPQAPILKRARRSNMSTSQPPHQPQNVSWREQRRMARQERRAARYSSRSGAWVGGAFLILLGVVFLLQNTGTILFGNWWALFILLPAVGAFSAAWRSYNRDGGQISGATMGSLIGGVVFSGLTIVLFFGFDLTWIGPAALILIGIGVLAAAFMKPGEVNDAEET